MIPLYEICDILCAQLNQLELQATYRQGVVDTQIGVTPANPQGLGITFTVARTGAHIVVAGQRAVETVTADIGVSSDWTTAWRDVAEMLEPVKHCAQMAKDGAGAFGHTFDDNMRHHLERL